MVRGVRQARTGSALRRSTPLGLGGLGKTQVQVQRRGVLRAVAAATAVVADVPSQPKVHPVRERGAGERDGRSKTGG
jgi:hypothetical protein